MMNWRAAARDGVRPVAFAAKLTETANARVASWFRLLLPPYLIKLLANLAGVEIRYVVTSRERQRQVEPQSAASHPLKA